MSFSHGLGELGLGEMGRHRAKVVGLVFCESDKITELAAFSWHHWTAEIFTVKTISSSRLKPH